MKSTAEHAVVTTIAIDLAKKTQGQVLYCHIKHHPAMRARYG